LGLVRLKGIPEFGQTINTDHFEEILRADLAYWEVVRMARLFAEGMKDYEKQSYAEITDLYVEMRRGSPGARAQTEESLRQTASSSSTIPQIISGVMKDTVR